VCDPPDEADDVGRAQLLGIARFFARVRCQEYGKLTVLRVIGLFEQMSIDRSLQMRMKVCFRLLYGQETMVALILVYKSLQFERF
jgi:hypothetical protein